MCQYFERNIRQNGFIIWHGKILLMSYFTKTSDLIAANTKSLVGQDYLIMC